MSRSSPTIQNPAKHFFEWAASRGELYYYDKEQAKQIPVKLPFEFLVLDELHTITGYDKQAQSGFWSNEVKNLKTEKLTVRNKNGIRYEGPYKDYERDIVLMPKGASYAKSIYFAYKEDGEWVIGNFKASGSARSAWFDFSGEHRHEVENGKIVMKKGEKQTAQTGDFYAPEFTGMNATPEENDIAIELDRELQNYLAHYLTSQPDEEPTDETESGVPTGGHFNDKATPEQVADFEKRKAEMFKKSDKQEDAAIREQVEDIWGDEPLPDIPPEFR